MFAQIQVIAGFGTQAIALFFACYFCVLSLEAHAVEATAKQVDLKIGQTQYSKTDGAVPLTGSARTMGLELSLFYKMDRSVVVGFREATDAVSQRAYYLASYAGWRYFPLGIGHPVQVVIDGNDIRYDSKFRPYVQGQIAIGRALYNPVLGGAQEQAADIFGLTLGTGMAWYPAGFWSLNFEVIYEQYQARGGTAEGLALSGTNIFTLLGSGYLF